MIPIAQKFWTFKILSIKITVEHASETIPFLDVEIKLNVSVIDTWIWKKPTHTSWFLNSNAFCPLKWKSGLILCLLYRDKRICSNNTLFRKEIENIKAMCKAKSYPSSRFFDKFVQQFHSHDNSNQSSVDTDQTSITVSLFINIHWLYRTVFRQVHDDSLVSFQK